MITSLIATIALTQIKPVPPTFKTIDGQSHTLKDHKVTVLIFLTPNCPIAQALQPTIQSLHKEFSKKDTAIYGIHVDPTLSAKFIKDFATDYQITYPQAIDQNHNLVKALKPTITPEAFVFNKSGNLKYQGRINDAFTTLGNRVKPKKHDLKNAIQAVLNNQTPNPAKTTPIGCIIPDLKDFIDKQ